MIFVTLGTQDKEFKRLIDIVVNANLKEEIIIQKGFTKFESLEIENFEYCDKDKYDDLIKKADVIITHGGVGSIMNALKNHKKVIAVARLSKYKEHQNDHQLDIVNNFASANYLFELKEGDNLEDLIIKIKKHNFNKISSNNDNFVRNLLKYLEL